MIKEGIERTIWVYNNSLESNVIMLSSKFLLNTQKGPVFRSFYDILCLYAWFLWRFADSFTR